MEGWKTPGGKLRQNAGAVRAGESDGGRSLQRSGRRSKESGQCFLTASRIESLAPPTVFCTLPSTLSALPSACSLLSPVILPSASFTAPLACLPAPSTRFL